MKKKNYWIAGLAVRLSGEQIVFEREKRGNMMRKGRKCYFMSMMAAAALAFALTGCGSSADGVKKSQSVESTAKNEEKNTGTQEDQKDKLEKLPAYTPVDPESVPVSAEGDFIFSAYTGGVVEITGYQGSATQIRVPDNLGGGTSIQLREDVFKGNDDITYVYLPETVTQVDEYAFKGCDALEELYMAGPADVSSGLCRGDESLRRVVLGEGCREIRCDGMDSGAFQECTSLTDVVFPASLEIMDYNSFKDCPQLTAADLSGTKLSTIGQQAFGGCGLLEEVKLPSTMAYLESNAFLNCQSLNSFVIDGASGIEVVDNVVYQGDVLLFVLLGTQAEEAVIREGTVTVATNAFEYDDHLKKVTFPDSVTEIGKNAFTGCEALEEVTFGKGLVRIGYSAFAGDASLREIILPDSVAEIGDVAFGFMEGLEKVTLPDNVKYAGNATTQEHVFSTDEKVVITYKGKEYTYEQAAELDAAIAAQ